MHKATIAFMPGLGLAIKSNLMSLLGSDQLKPTWQALALAFENDKLSYLVSAVLIFDRTEFMHGLRIY
jgi:hypothetical protein